MPNDTRQIPLLLIKKKSFQLILSIANYKYLLNKGRLENFYLPIDRILAAYEAL